MASSLSNLFKSLAVAVAVAVAVAALEQRQRAGHRRRSGDDGDAGAGRLRFPLLDVHDDLEQPFDEEEEPNAAPQQQRRVQVAVLRIRVHQSERLQRTVRHKKPSIIEKKNQN